MRNELWLCAVVGVLLLIGSIDDWRNHSIRISYPIAFFLGALVRQCIYPGFSWKLFWGGIAFGLAFYLLAQLNSGQIGTGDGLMLGVCGAYLGFFRVITLFARGIFGAALWGVCRLVVQFLKNGKMKETEMPFIPCLLVAYLTML